MKIVIIGGHLSPALSVSDHFPDTWKVIFYGRKNTMEGDKVDSFEFQTIRKKGYFFRSILTGRLQRTFTKYTVLSWLKIPVGIMQSFYFLSIDQPSAVMSFGGYVSFPVVFAAFFLRIPIVIHEQTLQIGLANKIAAFFAKKICVSWKESLHYFPVEKTVLTGIPIKLFTEDVSVSFPKGYPILLVTGGSAGSHAINLFVEHSLSELLSQFVVIHQTGNAQGYHDFERIYEKVKKLPLDLQKKYLGKKFIDTAEMGSFMKHADIVVSRAGINTVSELIMHQKVALLIPLHQEQWDNAHFFKQLGYGEILNQKTCTDKMFYEKVSELFHNRAKYVHTMKKGVLIPDAATRIVKVLEEVIRNSHEEKKI